MSDLATEKLAAWMCEHSFATGHGDTMDDLLKELSWQVKANRERERQLRDACGLKFGQQLPSWLHPKDEIL